MSTFILITLIGIVLYAIYLVWGPFSYRDNRWDIITNVVALIFWIVLSALITTELISVQPTVFATIINFIGVMLVTMFVTFGALLIVWLFCQWVYVSAVPAIERFFTRRK